MGGGYERRRPIIATLIAAALLTTALHAPASADSTINQTHELLADDGGYSDQFGWSVGLSGETAIIGARADDDGGSTTGSAYIFNTTSGDQIWKLKASDAGVGDQFGYAVDVSGTTALAGARYNDHDGLTSAGAAYLFDTTTGTQLHKLTASDVEAYDGFGLATGISGTTAIVGGRGAAYLFDATSGMQTQMLTASGTSARGRDSFGSAVDISGTKAIVADPRIDTAYIFDTSGNKLREISGATNNFGRSVAMDDDTAVIGGLNSAYLYDANTGQQLSELTAPDTESGDRFGDSVAIDNGFAIVGASYDGSGVGSAYVFDINTGDFLQKLTESDGQGTDRFGAAVGVSGSTFLTGAYTDDLTGAAYVFQRQSNPGPTVVPTPTAGAAGLLMLGLLATMSRPRRNQRET